MGFSTVDNRDIEHQEARGDRRNLFNGLHFLIATMNKSFAEEWKPLLTRLGAAVSVRSKGKIDRHLKDLDVVVGDEAPPASIVKDAREKDLFIVTTQWIVQCLINGQRLPHADFLL